MADEKRPPSSIGGEAIEKKVAPIETSEMSEKGIGSGPRQVAIVNAREIKHADEAMRAFDDYEGPGEVIDEATNRRLLRKIDMRIMPVCKRRAGNCGGERWMANEFFVRED